MIVIVKSAYVVCPVFMLAMLDLCEKTHVHIFVYLQMGMGIHLLMHVYVY